MVEREGIAVDITANVDSFSSSIGEAIQSLGGFRSAVGLAAGSAAAMFAKASFDEFAAYEQSITLVAQKTRASADEMQRHKQFLDELSASAAGARFSETELAAALADVAQGSRDVEQTQALLAAAAGLASARQLELSESTEALNAVLEASGRSGLDSVRVVEMLMTITDQYGGSVTDLADEIASTTVRASIFGVELEELAAIIGVLSSKRIDANALFVGLGTLDTADGETNVRLMDQFGVSAFNAAGELKPLDQITGELTETIERQGLTAEQTGQRLIEVFGKNAGLAFAGYLSALVEIDEAQQRVATSAGTMSAGVAASASTAGTKVDELRAKWANLKRELGEPSAGVAIPVLDALIAGLERIRGFDDYIGQTGDDIQDVFKGDFGDIDTSVRPGSAADRLNQFIGMGAPTPNIPAPSDTAWENTQMTAQTPKVEVRIENLSLPQVTDSRSFATEMQRFEFESQYRAGTWRRGT